MTDFINNLRRLGAPVVILCILYLMNPYDLGYIAGYLLVPIFYTRREFLVKNLDFDFFILFVFSSVYALFYFFNPEMYIQTFLMYMLFPPTFYLMGKYVGFKSKDVNFLFIIMLGTGILFSSMAFLSVGQALFQDGFLQTGRTLPNFYTGHPTSATGMGSFFTFNMCIPALLIAARNKINLFYKLLGIGIFVASMLCVFRLGSRTQVVVFVFSTIIALIYLMPRQSIKQNLKLFIGLALAALLVYMYVPLSLDADYLSVLGDRINNPSSSSTASAGNRTQRWLKSIENLLVKPFGWSRSEFGYSHNLWLDVAQDGGLLPFLFLLIFTIRNLISTKMAIFSKGKDILFKCLILTFVTAASLQFFVEPIMQGAFNIFVVYCFFQGVVKKYVENRKLEDNTNRVTSNHFGANIH